MLYIENYEYHQLTATMSLCEAILKSDASDSLSASTLASLRGIVSNIDKLMNAFDTLVDDEDTHTPIEAESHDSEDEEEEEEEETPCCRDCWDDNTYFDRLRTDLYEFFSKQ